MIMKKIIKTSVISILLIGLLINSAYAVYDWGIDDDGKFSYSKVMVFIKEEYTNDPETVINNIKRKYDVISAEVISDIKDPEHPLILLVKLPVSDEDFFYSTYNSLSQDKYVELVFKVYYVGADKSYLGDVNQDGRIQTDDACTILRYAAGHIEPETKTQEILADVDEDGVITTLDAKCALSVACGIIQ